MAITQIIAPLSVVLNDSETFYEDIAIRNNSLVTVSFPSVNTWATQANALADEVNDKAAQVAAQAVDGGYSQTYINTNFVGVDNAQDITEVKTFIVSPIVPTPTTDYQVANKKYIDDNNKINTLTNKITPAGSDEFVIADNASSFSLKKLSFTNLKTWLKTIFIQKDYIIISGSATFSPTLNTIVLTGVGSLGLKIGDVISITGSTGNNKTFSIEHINGDGSGLVTDNNTIIVNYEHRGASTPVPSKRLIAETATISITLITNPKEFEGLDWCVPVSRSAGVTYTNSTGKPIAASITGSNANGQYFITVSSVNVVDNFEISGADNPMFVIIPNSAAYSLTIPAGIIRLWVELR